VRLFIDRDLGPAIGLALQAVKVDAKNHVELFNEMAPDELWIPAVTAAGRVILSKDRRLRTRPAERAAFEAAGARCFVLTAEKQDRLSLLRCVLAAWDSIEDKVATVPAPFMYGIGRDGRLTQWIPVDGPDGPAERARRQQERALGRRRGPRGRGSLRP
jgi:hypothetical protein